jgi:hypothetical protein
MTDAEMNRILQDFANAHTLARDIRVTITPNSTHLEPREGLDGFKYEDGQMLTELIRGAEQLLMWARREGKVRFVRLASDCTRKGVLKPKIQLKVCKKGL